MKSAISAALAPAVRGWVVALSVLALLDFGVRVLVLRDGSNPPKETSTLLTPEVSEPAGVILQRLQTWIPFEMALGRSAAASPDALQLRAVAVTAQGSRAVLALKSPAGQITRHVRVGIGDEVEGWRVESIQPRKVLLQRDGNSHELALFRSAGAANGGD